MTNCLITSEVEDNIDSISYYYARKDKMNSILEAMTKKYNEINMLSRELDKIRVQLDRDLNGTFHDAFRFDKSGGFYTTKFIKKSKVAKGRLEDLKDYLDEPDENKAINKYLKNFGAKFYCGEIYNINDILGIEGNEDEEGLDDDEVFSVED